MSEWISVKDQLPEEIATISYLVTDCVNIEIAAYDLAFWDNANGQTWDWIFNGRGRSFKPKYWMLLPKPPKK